MFIYIHYISHIHVNYLTDMVDWVSVLICHSQGGFNISPGLFHSLLLKFNSTLIKTVVIFFVL